MRNLTDIILAKLARSDDNSGYVHTPPPRNTFTAPHATGDYGYKPLISEKASPMVTALPLPGSTTDDATKKTADYVLAKLAGKPNRGKQTRANKIMSNPSVNPIAAKARLDRLRAHPHTGTYARHEFPLLGDKPNAPPRLKATSAPALSLSSLEIPKKPRLRERAKLRDLGRPAVDARAKEIEHATRETRRTRLYDKVLDSAEKRQFEKLNPPHRFHIPRKYISAGKKGLALAGLMGAGYIAKQHLHEPHLKPYKPSNTKHAMLENVLNWNKKLIGESVERAVLKKIVANGEEMMRGMEEKMLKNPELAEKELALINKITSWGKGK